MRHLGAALVVKSLGKAQHFSNEVYSILGNDANDDASAMMLVLMSYSSFFKIV